MTRCHDWRQCTPTEIAPLIAAEASAWLGELNWDVTVAWSVIEPARRAGRLRGFVLRDGRDQISAWTAFLVHRDCLHVLAFSAGDEEAAAVLIDAILDFPEAAVARSVIVSVRAASAPLSPLLSHREFVIEPYRYLSKNLSRESFAPDGLHAWTTAADAVAELLARAYAGDEGLRAFAPHGTPDEWRDYLSGSINGFGCGRFAPELSFIASAGRGSGLTAAVIVTQLGPGTSHVAQLAVDPAARGRGLGARLVCAAEQAAVGNGAERMTLLVARSNHAAAAIYERLGYRDRAAFVVAVRRQPSLSTSPALATGGERTRL